MNELRGIYDGLNLRVAGLQGLSDLMCSAHDEEGLISIHNIGILLENEVKALRGLVDQLEVNINERV